MSTSTGPAQRRPALMATASIITLGLMGSVVLTPLSLGYRGSRLCTRSPPDDHRAEVVSTYSIARSSGTACRSSGWVLTTLTDPQVGTIVFAATIAALGIGAPLWRRSFAVSGQVGEQHRSRTP